MSTEIALTFNFDAAHHFRHAAPGHRHGRIHGHSFEATIRIAGAPDAETGFVVDFDHLRSVCAGLREELDHHLLNEIPGLETPSLEMLAAWIWRRLAGQFPGLTLVEVARPSVGERCFHRA